MWVGLIIGDLVAGDDHSLLVLNEGGPALVAEEEEEEELEGIVLELLELLELLKLLLELLELLRREKILSLVRKNFAFFFFHFSFLFPLCREKKLSVKFSDLWNFQRRLVKVGEGPPALLLIGWMSAGH